LHVGNACWSFFTPVAVTLVFSQQHPTKNAGTQTAMYSPSIRGCPHETFQIPVPA